MLKLKPIGNLKYALFIMIFLGLSACNHKPAPQSALPVSALKMQYSEIPLDREYIGVTKSMDAVKIRARVEGFLEQMLFKEGKQVHKNQLLFVIDQRPFQAKVDGAQGSLTRALADLEFTRVQYLRMKELVRKGDVSQSRYDEVRAQFKQAQGNVEIAKANLTEAQINLGYCSMVSPFDGLIGKRYVDIGNLVGGTQNTILAEVVQLNPIYVEFSPSLSDFSDFLKYRDNMPFKATITLPKAKNIRFSGKLDLVNNIANLPTSTILMRAIIDNPEQLLRPNIYVNVHLHLTKHAKVLLLPSTAIMETQGQQSVYVIDAENRVKARDVHVGGQYHEDKIITSGLHPGDIVVLDNLQKLQQSMLVHPMLVTANASQSQRRSTI